MSLVAVLGVGGLGCPAALALGRAGVRLRLVDEDRVERSNLHRQGLYEEADVGRPKVAAAREALLRAAPGAAVEARQTHFSPDTMDDLLDGVDLVVEGTDAFGAKFLVADRCAARGVPVVHGACVGWYGTVLPVAPGEGPCYRCVFEDAPGCDEDAGTCVTAGVYGPVPALVGALLAVEALRLLRGDHGNAGRVLWYDAWRQVARELSPRRRSRCPNHQPDTIHPRGGLMVPAPRSTGGRLSWPSR
ncbi:MAG: HesA/MoeB/ThiF family protein [Deltaproteobacteria bacterium]|nr:HesA/MoeB/ThiF family protein [Deltaproteobacteria bacterium]